MIKAKKVAGICCILLLFLLILWTIWGNTALTVTEYTITSSRLPDAFSGFRIAQISDLHNAVFGTENQTLINILQSTNPNIIVITGDLVDSRRTDIGAALSFATRAATIAPCYYVPGNHEARIREYEDFLLQLQDCGINVLDNKQILLHRNDDFIALAGIEDPSFYEDYLFGDSAAVIQTLLSQISQNEKPYTILLAHRPELFEIYSDFDYDLVFSGHAHGGQFRLPFIGGLIAPNQGFFPKYDAGLFLLGNTNMIVSRGIGNSILPLRFNNRPEIIVAELKSE